MRSAASAFRLRPRPPARRLGLLEVEAAGRSARNPRRLTEKSPQRRPSRHPSIPGGWSRQSRGPGAGLWRLVWCYFISVALWGDAVRKQWGARALRTSSPFLWMANACELARPGTRAAGRPRSAIPSLGSQPLRLRLAGAHPSLGEDARGSDRTGAFPSSVEMAVEAAVSDSSRGQEEGQLHSDVPI